ncbi:MAG: DUF4445 domain-containing protein [Mogibacterium sp.]|nr:DUF4445 domain-containing protein [Mogibacterium sp.]
MYTITVSAKGQTFEYEPGKSLLDILLENDVFVDNPCGGMGVCGKCKVRVISGDAGKMLQEEADFLTAQEIESGVRLSCKAYPESDLVVEQLQVDRKGKVLTSGYMPEFNTELDICKKAVSIHKPTLEDQTAFEDQIINQIGDVEIPLDVLETAVFNEGVFTAVTYESADGNRKLIALEDGDTTDKLYGIVIDIGTTTVVTELVDMTTGEALANSSMINAQKTYGLDVLTRITYEFENTDTGIENLQTAIVDSINDMIEDVCTQAGVDRSNVYQVSVGANCTMMHMLLGVDAKPIGKSPYAPMFVKAKDIPAEDIGIVGAKGARLYCLPSVSAYIGADIVAGAYVCELQKTDDNILFIDIGTNGEIVLASNGKLTSCSCAAGPALEGMNISCGMRAAEGAIEDVTITEEGVSLKVIGGEDVTPVGICGSGILAVVKELIRTGFVLKEGAFVKPKKLAEDDFRLKMIELDGIKRSFVMCEGDEQTPRLLITQGDVRQVQLAKGAILSGFYALLNKAGVSMEELDKIMIAGQFGAHLPADSLTGTGIIPKGLEDKIVYVGNSSKTGAYMALMSKTVKREMEELAHNMDYMELGASENYERLFAECLVFPE